MEKSRQRANLGIATGECLGERVENQLIRELEEGAGHLGIFECRLPSTLESPISFLREMHSIVLYNT